MTALPDTFVTLGIRKATVATVTDAGTHVTFADGQCALAQSGLEGVPSPRAGDPVLVAGTLDGEFFVVGVLRREGARTLRMEAHGHATVVTVTGDLELRAPEGHVRIDARDGVSLRSATQVQVEAPRLIAATHDAELTSAEASVTVDTLSVHAKKALHVIGLLDVRATRILERAKDVFRDVEGQMQTRAGRIRVVAEETYNLLARRTLIKAREDVKLKGEKIYLG